MRVTGTLVLLFALGCVVHGGAVAHRNAFDWSWLNRLLHNVSIPISLPPIPLGPLGTVTIRDFQCEQPSLGGLGWNYTAPTLDLQLSGLAIHCLGTISYPSGKKDANITVSIAQSGLSTAVDFKFTDGFPSAASTIQHCIAQVQIDNILISGLSGAVISLLIDLAKPVIQQTLETEVCKLLGTYIDIDLTQLLQTTSGFAQPLIAPLPSPPPPLAAPSGMLNWTENSLLGMAHAATNLFCADTADCVDRVVRDRNVTASLASLPPLALQLNTALANATVQVLSATVAGVSSLRLLDVLEPYGESKKHAHCYL